MHEDIFGATDTNNADTRIKKSDYVELDDILNPDTCKPNQNDQEMI